MKLLITLILSTVAIFAQSITIKVTDKNGIESNAKITGAKANVYLDVFNKWMATQQTCVTSPGTPAVVDDKGVITTPAVAPVTTCTPIYANYAELFQIHLVNLATGLEPSFPAAADKPDIDEITAKQAALEAKRKSRAEAAKGEK